MADRAVGEAPQSPSQYTQMYADWSKSLPPMGTILPSTISAPLTAIAGASPPVESGLAHK